MADETVMAGGKGGSRGRGDLNNIGSVPDSAVATDEPWPTADGYPVSPAVAARRYGAAAGRGERGGNPDPGSGSA